MEQKVNGPGIALIVVGVIGALFALVRIPAGILQMSNPDMARALHDVGLDASAGIGLAVCGGILALIGSVLTIVAGAKMRGLSGYGLAIAGSILAMIPCTNGCCCIGLPIGIWSIVVLMDPQVKASFR